MRIVVLGGYGNFGARICRALTEHSGIEVIAAGRNPDYGPQDIFFESRIQKARLDLASPDFPEALKSLSPQIVFHCAGPFQGQDYRVVSATTFAGTHYNTILPRSALGYRPPASPVLSPRLINPQLAVMH